MTRHSMRQVCDLPDDGPAPWLDIAAEARWRVLAHLKTERRAAIRKLLEAHVARLEETIRAQRKGRTA